MAPSSRLFLLGIDGLPPRAFRRFSAEGLLPNCQALIEASASFDVLPTLPALTAPGWMTIASGAHPRTIGVSTILQPQPGQPPDLIRNGFDRRLSRVEYLWEAFDAESLPAIVLHYPGSWPPREGGFVQVDGAGGYADITCAFEAVASGAYVAGAAARVEPEHSHDACGVPRGYRDHWRIDAGGESGLYPVTTRAPLSWRNLPAGFAPAFECVLPVQVSGQRARTILHALGGRMAGRPRLIVSSSRDAALGVADLGIGEWSGWIEGDGYRCSTPSPTLPPQGGGRDDASLDLEGGGREEKAYALRLKLLALDPEQGSLHLYRSQGHRSRGFTRPPELAEELLAACGPMVEWAGTFDVMNGLADLDTELELYDAHTAWLERAIEHLTEREWAGFFVHWHLIEYAHHVAGAALDADHPLHDRAQASQLDFLRQTYRLLDRLVGTVVRSLGGGDTLALASDHGHDLVHTLFHVNDFLRQRGFLDADRDDPLRVDWSRTRAYGLFPGAVYLNSRRWWSGGIVGEAQAPAVLAEVSAALRDLVDPRTGRAVVDGVFGPEELVALGQGGPQAPDLMFTMARGYEPATRLQPQGSPCFVLTEPGRELTSGHGSFHPLSASARTLALIRHPELAPGSKASSPVHLVDLAPTLAALVGVRPPRDADGRALDMQALGVKVGVRTA
jgi:predicted AlkP superfamily phosphohydrolase/phosphomutase